MQSNKNRSCINDLSADKLHFYQKLNWASKSPVILASKYNSYIILDYQVFL